MIKESLDKADSIRIDYLTVTTSAACLLCVDSNGDALTQCMMVSDKRAKEQSDTMSKMKAFLELQEEQDIAADPYYMIPKAMWIKDNEKEIYNNTYKFLAPNDYLIAKLTGNYVTDYINGLKWYCDAKNKTYPEKLLTEVEIDISKLPRIVSPGESVANIRDDVAKLLGINNDVNVVASTYDAICSFIGSGTLNDGEACDVSGTVTVFRTCSKKKVDGTLNGIQQIPYYEAGLNIIGGSNNMGGGLIEWVKQCYYHSEDYPYELMEKEAIESPVGSRGLIFLPYLMGERTPIWDMDARGVFFGLERMHTRKEMTRAVFESAGYIDLDMMNAIKESGVEVNSIRVSGGLARINLISQIKADVTGCEVHVLSEFETTATGAAMIAMFGQGVYNTLDEAAGEFVKMRMIIKPDLENHERYTKIFELYKDVYKSLKPLFAKRRNVVEDLYQNTKVKIENL